MPSLKQTEQTRSWSQWKKNGEHWVWVNASAVAICLIMVIGLIGLIVVRGLGHFWVNDVQQIQLQNGTLWLGEQIDTEKSITNDAKQKSKTQILYKVGNREEYSLDFKWFDGEQIKNTTKPEWVAVIERYEWGNAYGKITNLHWQGKSHGINEPQALDNALQAVQNIREKIHTIEKNDIGRTNYQLNEIRLERKKIKADNSLNEIQKNKFYAQLDHKEKKISAHYQEIKKELDKHHKKLEEQGYVTFVLSDNKSKQINLGHIVRVYFPNQMDVVDRTLFYFEKLWEFIIEDPREANTEGGIFPAIFGTVALVMLMTLFVTPLGIITAIYLREYTRQGLLVRIIRISVNNLAGVPSIVYGVFGLGFFVYFMGGSIDELFYSFNLPSPTFGSPNMLWASLTLTLLTLPVVIVSTEEGLNRIPRAIREGSLALGSTKFEVLWRIIIPMISPSIMTGIILAIARAAGEVAPLMLVGVVKLAPDLVIDGNAPFIHLDRQFMHLGFHIFDVGFQSPNIEAAQPLVYATAALLIFIILLLNITTIIIRNNLREKYKALE
jgi:phosphate transport system permease protein